MLHGCTIEDDSLIGIGAIVLNGARIGKGAVVAAGCAGAGRHGSPPDMLVMGAPAKPRRPVSAEEQARFRRRASSSYVENAAASLQGRVGSSNELA